MRESQKGELFHKSLERKRGFLIYVTRTYPSMVPYLKGIHLTLVGWRQGRDDEGWKQLAPVYWKLHDMNEKAPEKVCAVPRLENDIAALLTLTEAKEPPERKVRSKAIIHIYYGFGDASAVGFCSTFQKMTKEEQGFVQGEEIGFRYGHWCTEKGEASISF